MPAHGADDEPPAMEISDGQIDDRGETVFVGLRVRERRAPLAVACVEDAVDPDHDAVHDALRCFAQSNAVGRRCGPCISTT